MLSRLASGGGTERHAWSWTARGRGGSQGDQENTTSNTRCLTQGFWKVEVFGVVSFSTLTSSPTDQMVKI